MASTFLHCVLLLVTLLTAHGASIDGLPPGLADNEVKEGETPDTSITDKVYFNISIGGQPMGVVAIGLYGKIAPLTVKNFVELAKGSVEKKDGYKGSIFHRVIRNFMIQGGDFISQDGTGSSSIYGDRFRDENFTLKHKCGRLAMANAGPNTNGCQFYILTAQTAEWIDGAHTVFGVVLSGMDIVRKVEVEPTNHDDRPSQPCLITDSRAEAVQEAFTFGINEEVDRC